MSSFGVVEYKNYSLRVPPACRLIPGRQSTGVPPRKKAQSLSQDEVHWFNPSGPNTAKAEPQSVIALLGDALLPGPFARIERIHVAVQAGADILLLTGVLSVLSLTIRGKADFGLLGAGLIYGVLLTLLGHSEGLYAHPQRGEREIAILGKSIAWATILVAVVVRLTKLSGIPTGLLLASAPLNYFGMLGWRQGLRLRCRTQKGPVRNVLIVGAGRTGRAIAEYIDAHHPGRRFFRGFLDNSMRPSAEIRGTIAELAKVARAQFADEVILAIPHQRELAQEVIRDARKNHLDIKVVPDFMGFEPVGDALESYGLVPLVTLHSEVPPAIALLMKRLLDCVISATALLFSSPLMLLIALAVKLESSGPVFYCAPRMGKKGRQFLCYKFRTMAADAEATKEKLRADNQREGPFFKMANDPRLTRIGHLLRRYSFDELPQLWNVFRGEMSLVGPRPHPLDDFRRYRLEDFRRLDATPGITGLWQVTARRDPSFERNMALDLQYIEQWSLALDLKILWKTMSVVLHGTGA